MVQRCTISCNSFSNFVNEYDGPPGNSLSQMTHSVAHSLNYRTSYQVGISLQHYQMIKICLFRYSIENKLIIRMSKIHTKKKKTTMLESGEREKELSKDYKTPLPVNYKEYDVGCDQEDEPKKCRTSLNCLLDRCVCKRGLIEGVQELQPMKDQRQPHVITDKSYCSTARTVQISPSNPYGNQARTVGALPVESVPASIHTNIGYLTASQLPRSPRSINNTCSGTQYRIGLLLLCIFLYITGTEGNRDVRESQHHMYGSNCNIHPTMYSYPMPVVYLLPLDTI